MFKRILSILLISVFLIGTFAACGDDDDISLIMPIASDPMCVDPQIAETDVAKTIVLNCYEGLVRLDEEYKIIPGVAESWTVSPDGLTYTFKLRQDTNWQLLKAYKDVLADENYMEDFETAVTAYDFEFALRRAVDKTTDSPDAQKLYCIRNARAIHLGDAEKSSLGVKATDAFTLTITLERANPDFLRVLTLPLCMPCNEEFFNSTRAKYGLETKYTMCNGPFYLGRWTQDHSVVMYRNEGYKGNAKVKPTAIYLNINKEEDSVITKLKQSTYHCALVSDEAHFSLSDNKKIRNEVTVNTVVGLAFNCEDKIFSNVNFRKALSMLTDTAVITGPDEAIGDAKGIIPESCRYSDKAYRQAAGAVSPLGYNESTAFELWKKGLEENELTAATVKVLCTDEYATQMQKAIQNWQRVFSTTIIAKVEVVSEDELSKAIKSDSYQIAVTGITSKSSTPTDTLEFFTTDNSKNIFNYSDSDYDALTESIVTAVAGNDILLQTKAAEQHLINNAVFFPIHTYGDYFEISKDADGIHCAPAFEGVCFINGGTD